MPDAGRPNILHLLSDQHSPYVAGCFGDPVVQTPHLDRLAAAGTVLEATYCPSPICVPSRMSMLTGRHPSQNACWTNSHILDSGIPTFAHALGAAGYRTCLVGRMHSLGPDQLRGYAERLVGDHSPNFDGIGGPPRGLLDGTAGPARVALTNSGPGQGGYQVHDEAVTAAAVDWLNRRGVARRSAPPGAPEAPFLLSVGFMLPHQPFVARRPEFERYRGRVPATRYPRPSQPEHPYISWWRARTGTEAVSPEETERCRTAYWALVDRLDAMIGQVLRALEENGLGANTLVVYTSDHGEQAGEHGLWWKQTMYEASARVPAIVSWPGVLPAGRRCRRVVSALDLTATILDAAGAPPLPEMRGRSVLGLLGRPGEPAAGAPGAAPPPA
ncbi:MAG TPA: sulfatase-like hydrolase/transferase, partial [Chloroflexota bacterium]|nr:sulfatase-like hydrolase/transferase [Chloroflexota bacterium]